jgi:hypothetical protein
MYEASCCAVVESIEGVETNNGNGKNGNGHGGNGKHRKGVIGYGGIEETVKALYEEHKGLICKVAKSYNRLNPTVDFLEFLNAGYIAVDIAVMHYNYRKSNGKVRRITKTVCGGDIEKADKEFRKYVEYLAESVYNGDKQNNGIDFTTYLHFHLQKCFEEICPANDKIVLLISPDGQSNILSYYEFQRKKKTLAKTNHTYLVQNITVPLTEYTNSNNRKRFSSYEG